jgi:flagellar basal body L-ring protein FlgH
MRVLEVFLNGERLCSAGAEDGAISAVVSSAPDCFCHVGASVGPNGDYAKWVDHKPLKIGDEITIRIRESNSADEPTSIEKAPKHR